MPRRKGADKHKISVKIGKAIERRRLLRNLSQEELAEIVELSPNHFGCIERGEANAPVITLAKIAKALKWNLSDLFFAANL